MLRGRALPSCQIALHQHLKLGSSCYHAYLLGRKPSPSRECSESRKYPVSCSMFYLKVDADSFVQGLEAGACRMHWEEWIPTCESTTDLIVLGLTSLFLCPDLWSEYHSPCRKYFQPPDASICWHLRRRNFPPCSQSMSVAVISAKSCHC